MNLKARSSTLVAPQSLNGLKLFFLVFFFAECAGPIIPKQGLSSTDEGGKLQ